MKVKPRFTVKLGNLKNNSAPFRDDFNLFFCIKFINMFTFTMLRSNFLFNTNIHVFACVIGIPEKIWSRRI